MKYASERTRLKGGASGRRTSRRDESVFDDTEREPALVELRSQ
jgi:hypothetical protein